MKWTLLLLITNNTFPLQVGEYSVANRTLALNKQHLKFYRAHKNQNYTATSKCLESDGDVCKQCYQNPESGNV